MEYAIGYLAGVVATLIFAAVMTPDNELRPVTIICLTWPVMMPVILLAMLLHQFKIEFDIDKGPKLFGFRKSPNPNIVGFGITAFRIELRFFKRIKA